jgi:hypothetical protein
MPCFCQLAEAGWRGVREERLSKLIRALAPTRSTRWWSIRDGHGGTLISEAAQTSVQSPLLTQPHG